MASFFSAIKIVAEDTFVIVKTTFVSLIFYGIYYLEINYNLNIFVKSLLYIIISINLLGYLTRIARRALIYKPDVLPSVVSKWNIYYGVRSFILSTPYIILYIIINYFSPIILLGFSTLLQKYISIFLNLCIVSLIFNAISIFIKESNFLAGFNFKRIFKNFLPFVINTCVSFLISFLTLFFISIPITTYIVNYNLRVFIVLYLSMILLTSYVVSIVALIDEIE